jgi:hypothetical protein
MDPIATFELVTLFDTALPLVLVLSISLAPFSRNRGMRAILAVLIAWIASVIYVGAIYNPAGIAAGHALGWHFPENRYDSNTIASTILGGWIQPTLCVIVLAVSRRIYTRIQKHRD